MRTEDYLRLKRSLKLRSDGEACCPVGERYVLVDFTSNQFGFIEYFSQNNESSSLEEIAAGLENQALEEGVQLQNPVLPILLKIQSELPEIPEFFKKNPIDKMMNV